jgi:hypothetical protein
MTRLLKLDFAWTLKEMWAIGARACEATYVINKLDFDYFFAEEKKMPKEEWIPATSGSIPPPGWILVRENTSGQDYWVDPKTLKANEPTSKLSLEQIERIKVLELALREHDSSSVDEWLTNMRRDRNPEAEIQAWEVIVEVYEMELKDRPLAHVNERHLVYAVLVSASTLTKEICDPGKVMSMYPKAKSLPNLERVVDRFREKRFGM